MCPSWFSIIMLALVDIAAVVALVKIFVAYETEMKSRNKEWEDQW